MLHSGRAERLRQATNTSKETILSIRTTCLSALMLASAGFATSASAAQVVDQQNTVFTAPNNTGTASPSIGQSFTAGMGQIDFVTFSLYVTRAASYRVDLYAGSGFAGTLLGSSNTQALAIGTTVTPVEFDFGSQISLDVNSVYTVNVVQVGQAPQSFKLGALISRSNPYAGGSWFNADGTATLANDMVFAEGYTPTAAVPEPANAALLMAGLGFTGWVARRRKTPR